MSSIISKTSAINSRDAVVHPSALLIALALTLLPALGAFSLVRAVRA